MDPHLALDRLILERAALYAALLSLDEETLATRPLCGRWAARDVLAHITGWEARFAGHLPALLADRGMEIPDVLEPDAYNDRLVAERRGLPLGAVLEELDHVLDRITALLDPLPAAELARPRRVPWAEMSAETWVRMEAAHDAEHTAGIQAWRANAHLGWRPGPPALAVHAIRNARRALQRLTGRMAASDRDTAPLCGTWTAKDVIGHLADWTGTMAEAAMQALETGTLPVLPQSDEALDAWNASHVARRREQPWPQVWAAYDAACDQAIAALEGLGAEALARPYPGAVPPTLYHWLSITGHDVEHARQILAHLE